MLAAPLLVGLAGAAVVVFAAVLGTSLEGLLDARAPTPGDPTPPPAFSTIVTDPGTAVTPVPALAAPPPADTRAVSPARPARALPVRAALPRATVTDRRSPPPLEERQDDEVVAPVPEEPSNEAADPTSVIDWLLNRSATNGR
jgi:hypothetical protein